MGKNLHTPSRLPPSPLPSPSLQPLPTISQSRPIFDLLSNVVDHNNEMGIQELMDSTPDTTFSQDLLNSAEGYGLYLSAVLEQDQENDLEQR